MDDELDNAFLVVRRQSWEVTFQESEMLDAFNRHPSEVGETYVEHLGHAGGFGAEMVAGGLACLIHAVFPFWFEKTASQCIQRLHAQMTARRRITPPDDVRGRAETWSYSI